MRLISLFIRLCLCGSLGGLLPDALRFTFGAWGLLRATAAVARPRYGRCCAAVLLLQQRPPQQLTQIRQAALIEQPLAVCKVHIHAASQPTMV
jgi:hypothetical protein